MKDKEKSSNHVVLKCSISVVYVVVSFSSVKPPAVAAKAARAPLKEDDFPSLPTTAVASPMTPAYHAQTKKTSSFQEEDFPALVSKIRPLKTAARSNSAWSNHTPVAKPTTHPPPSSRAPPPLSSASSGPQTLSSSTLLSSRRKKKVGDSGKATSTRSPPPSSDDDDEGGGLTQQEFRSVPTMLDISSLLTVKGGNSKPPPVNANPPNQTPNPDPSTSKTSRKKKQQKNTAAPSTSTPVLGMTQSVSAMSVETAAQKENVPEKTWNKPLSSAVTAALTSGLTNGHPEKSPPIIKEAVVVTPQPNTDPPLEQEEEEFPALMTKKPPPGTVLLDNVIHHLSKFSFVPFFSLLYQMITGGCDCAAHLRVTSKSMLQLILTSSITVPQLTRVCLILGS